MLIQDIGSLPVCDEQTIVGIITDRDIAVRAIANGLDPKETRVQEVMSSEVFSCPVKTSINGLIQFNTPTLYSGTKFENVRLEFEEGKVINATSNNTKRH